MKHAVSIIVSTLCFVVRQLQFKATGHHYKC